MQSPRQSVSLPNCWSVCLNWTICWQANTWSVNLRNGQLAACSAQECDNDSWK